MCVLLYKKSSGRDNEITHTTIQQGDQSTCFMNERTQMEISRNLLTTNSSTIPGWRRVSFLGFLVFAVLFFALSKIPRHKYIKRHYTT